MGVFTTILWTATQLGRLSARYRKRSRDVAGDQEVNGEWNAASMMLQIVNSTEVMNDRAQFLSQKDTTQGQLCHTRTTALCQRYCGETGSRRSRNSSLNRRNRKQTRNFRPNRQTDLKIYQSFRALVSWQIVQTHFEKNMSTILCEQFLQGRTRVNERAEQCLRALRE